MTPTQLQVMQFIADYTVRNSGLIPTYQQMSDGLKMASKSGPFRIVNQLVELGFLYRDEQRGRNRNCYLTEKGHEWVERSEAYRGLIHSAAMCAQDAVIDAVQKTADDLITESSAAYEAVSGLAIGMKKKRHFVADQVAARMSATHG